MTRNCSTWSRWKFAICSPSINFPGDKTPIIRGSATAALAGKPEGEKAIQDLLDAVDTFIPLPTREVDKPFPDVHRRRVQH